MNFKIGDEVVFHPKVFLAPYTPYYDDYQAQLFEIVAFHEGEHIELKCISTPSLKVAGCVHEDELLGA